MGTTLYLVDGDWKNTGLVEYGLAGDRDFLTWMHGLPRQDHPKADPVTDYCFRPLEIDRWRAALPEDRPNPDRFPEFFDLIESRDDIWINVSF